MNDHAQRRCIELSLESSDEEDNVVRRSPVGSFPSNSPLPSAAAPPPPPPSNGQHCVVLSLDSDDDESIKSIPNEQIHYSVVDGVSSLLFKRASVQAHRYAQAAAQKRRKLQQQQQPKPVNPYTAMLSGTFTNMATALPHLRFNLMLLPQMEQTVVEAAKVRSRLPPSLKDFEGIVEAYMTTLVCNVLHGNGQLMKKLAPFLGEAHHTALSTLVRLMETHLMALVAANKLYRANLVMIAAFLASIPHLGRDHGSMLSALGLTVGYLEAIMSTVTKLPKQFTERGKHVLLEWVDVVSAQNFEVILFRSVATGRLTNFLVFFSCLLAVIPHNVVFGKCGNVILSLLKVVFQADLHYGTSDKMQSEVGHHLFACIQDGFPYLDLPQRVEDYLQEGAQTLRLGRVALIFFVLFALHRRQEFPPATDSAKFLASVGVGLLDGHLSLHVICGLTQCQLMGFKARQDEAMEVACAFAVNGLSNITTVDRFSACVPDCIWQLLLAFPSLFYTPAVRDRRNFRFLHSQPLGDLCPERRRQTMGYVLYSSQLLHILSYVLIVYINQGAQALVSFIDSNLLLVNLVWKGLFAHFLADSVEEGIEWEFMVAFLSN